MSKEFKSFYKVVGGNEGNKCHYNTRLDTYGCGCEHDCSYCYAKSLLNFRGLWNPSEPSVADIEKIRRKVKRIPSGTVVRLGGMTNCFAPIELKHRNTLETIKALNDADIEYLIVTKSDIVARDEYIDAMRKDLAHIQITITCFDDEKYKDLGYEKASVPSKRIAAVEKLNSNGFDVAIRLSPFIPEFIDFDKLNSIKCDKMVVEFLRVNTWIKKWFDIDYNKYTLSDGRGYHHLPLEKKIEYINKIKGKQITVCEDEDGAYEYWKNNVNPNPNDCCNLRKRHDEKTSD